MLVLTDREARRGVEGDPRLGVAGSRVRLLLGGGDPRSPLMTSARQCCRGATTPMADAALLCNAEALPALAELLQALFGVRADDLSTTRLQPIAAELDEAVTAARALAPALQSRRS